MQPWNATIPATVFLEPDPTPFHRDRPSCWVGRFVQSAGISLLKTEVDPKHAGRACSIDRITCAFRKDPLVS